MPHADLRLWTLMVSCLLLSACGGGGSDSTTSSIQDATQNSGTSSTDTQLPTVTQPLSTTGRLLASNCFQCHGTNGTGGFERITGGEADEVFEYQQIPADSDIMAAHAQGYSTAQLQAILIYLNQIR